jgi:hypothetical protein
VWNLEIIGALTRNSKTVYFCEYRGAKEEQMLLARFTNGSRYAAALSSLNVRAIAIESSDRMQTELNMVGFVFKNVDEEKHRIVMLGGYEELSMYMTDCL